MARWLTVRHGAENSSWCVGPTAAKHDTHTLSPAATPALSSSRVSSHYLVIYSYQYTSLSTSKNPPFVLYFLYFITVSLCTCSRMYHVFGFLFSYNRSVLLIYQVFHIYFFTHSFIFLFLLPFSFIFNPFSFYSFYFAFHLIISSHYSSIPSPQSSTSSHFYFLKTFPLLNTFLPPPLTLTPSLLYHPLH